MAQKTLKNIIQDIEHAFRGSIEGMQCPLQYEKWLEIKAKFLNPYKAGDRVRYKDDDPRIFTVYAVYDDKHVSLGLYKYPDTEQDRQTCIDDIYPCNIKQS